MINFWDICEPSKTTLKKKRGPGVQALVWRGCKSASAAHSAKPERRVLCSKSLCPRCNLSSLAGEKRHMLQHERHSDLSHLAAEYTLTWRRAPVWPSAPRSLTSSARSLSRPACAAHTFLKYRERPALSFFFSAQENSRRITAPTKVSRLLERYTWHSWTRVRWGTAHMMILRLKPSNTRQSTMDPVDWRSTGGRWHNFAKSSGEPKVESPVIGECAGLSYLELAQRVEVERLVNETCLDHPKRPGLRVYPTVKTRKMHLFSNNLLKKKLLKIAF